MRKPVSKKRSKKGQTGKNRQWVREHKVHRARLFYGDTDKLTGKKL